MNEFNILIIEDESLIALRIKQILERNNYTVIGIAQDNVTAVNFIQEYKVDLILADITIKGYLNGIETVKLIQESFDIQAIFLTSHQEDKFLEQVSTVTFTGYIVKPFIEEHLIREVKLAYLRLKNAHSDSFITLKPCYKYDIDNQIIRCDNEEIILSKNEKFFLHLLVINRNTTVTNEQIDLLVWNDNIVDEGSRRQLLFRLRKKVPHLDIQTIKGKGYTLIV